jgi:tetratricopeptide (TPR) repeat protein
MGSVFRIGMVETLSDTDRVSTVRLYLTNDEDTQLMQLTERFRLEMVDIPPHQKLMHLLIRMGEYQQAEQIALFYMKPLTEGPAASLFNRSMIHWVAGDQETAHKMCVEGLELERRTLSPNDPKLIQTYGKLAYIYSTTGRINKALECYLRYVEIERDRPSIASAYGSIGRIYEIKDEFYSACTYYKQALELRLKYLPETHPEIAVSYLRLGVISHKLDYYSDALVFLKKSLEIQQSSLPEYHHQIADTHHWIGSALALQGNMQEAIKHFEKAITIGSKTFGAEHAQIREYIKARDCLELLKD